MTTNTKLGENGVSVACVGSEQGECETRAVRMKTSWNRKMRSHLLSGDLSSLVNRDLGRRRVWLEQPRPSKLERILRHMTTKLGPYSKAVKIALTHRFSFLLRSPIPVSLVIFPFDEPHVSKIHVLIHLI